MYSRGIFYRNHDLTSEGFSRASSELAAVQKNQFYLEGSIYRSRKLDRLATCLYFKHSCERDLASVSGLFRPCAFGGCLRYHFCFDDMSLGVDGLLMVGLQSLIVSCAVYIFLFFSICTGTFLFFSSPSVVLEGMSWAVSAIASCLAELQLHTTEKLLQQGESVLF